jgi:hypothetical protein
MRQQEDHDDSFQRHDYFCEDYAEFGSVLSDMAADLDLLALQVPTDGLFAEYRDRLLAVAREVGAIEGGPRAVIATLPRSGPSWRRDTW